MTDAIPASTLTAASRAEEECRALRGQLRAEQRALEISEEVVRSLTAEVARIREAGKELTVKYSKACNELAELKKKLSAKE